MTTKALAESLGIEVPAEFICPISGEIMSSPMMTLEGVNFDRNSFVQRMRRGDATCPITNKTIKLANIAPNKNLEEKIAHWRWINMLPETPATRTDHFGIISSPLNKTSTPTSFPKRISPKKFSIWPKAA
jgi:U-box domain